MSLLMIYNSVVVVVVVAAAVEVLFDDFQWRQTNEVKLGFWKKFSDPKVYQCLLFERNHILSRTELVLSSLLQLHNEFRYVVSQSH